MQSTTLYRLQEISDLFVDACVRDPERGELLFLSIYGRDGQIQQFLAALTLRSEEGGFRQFTLASVLDADAAPSTVHVANAGELSKHSGKLPQNIFGNLAHVWLYSDALVKPDHANGRAWLLVSDHLVDGRPSQAALDRMWERLKELSPVPLADEWRDDLIASAQACGFVEWVGLDKDCLYPPLGRAGVCRIDLGTRWVEHVSGLVRSGALSAPGTANAQASASAVAAPEAFRVPPLALGQVVVTPGVQELPALKVMEWLRRHQSGDWGLVSGQDRLSNARAVASGEERVMSSYPIDESSPSKGHGDNTVWVITEWDRSVTTVLLPEEY